MLFPVVYYRHTTAFETGLHSCCTECAKAYVMFWREGVQLNVNTMKMHHACGSLKLESAIKHWRVTERTVTSKTFWVCAFLVRGNRRRHLPLENSEHRQFRTKRISRTPTGSISFCPFSFLQIQHVCSRRRFFRLCLLVARIFVPCATAQSLVRITTSSCTKNPHQIKRHIWQSTIIFCRIVSSVGMKNTGTMLPRKALHQP
jgi:hypothetical protein